MTTTQTFRAPTLTEARRAAEGALGDDAIVLSTRRVRRSGLAGLFGTTDIEIVATPASRAGEPQTPAGTYNPATATATATAASAARRLPFARAVYDAPTAPAAATAARHPPPGAEDQASREERVARAELAAMRNELRLMKAALATPIAPSPEIVAELTAVRDAVEALTPAAKKGDKATGMVKARGIEGTAAAALTRALKAREGDDANPSERFRDALADVIRVSAWPLTGEGRRMIALVGPAGVGKTTTAAKLAARARMEGRTVAFIACDTFRVGAVEQLQRYGRLLGARVSTARSRAELAAAIAISQADVVIVDTSGRAPQAGGLESLLAPGQWAKSGDSPMARHVLLCIPAALRAADAARVVKAFAPLGPTALAVTKLDETDAPSGLVHGTAAARLPVSVLCFGQRVPEDVAPATTAAILDHLDPRSPARAA